MGRLTEFLMKAPPPPHGMGFSMPMMKGWVPRRLQPWIYVLTALCFQFSGGVYLGALDEIRGTTNFMIEDVMFLLYATLAGMAVWFPMLFVELQLLKCKNVVPILIVVTLAELAFGTEHTLEEILYTEVVGLEELTKESQYMWVLPGMFLGIGFDLYWLKVHKWKVWKLIGIAFLSIFAYALLMYSTLSMDVNIEQYRLAIMLRGFGYGALHQP